MWKGDLRTSSALRVDRGFGASSTSGLGDLISTGASGSLRLLIADSSTTALLLEPSLGVVATRGDLSLVRQSVPDLGVYNDESLEVAGLVRGRDDDGPAWIVRFRDLAGGTGSGLGGGRVAGDGLKDGLGFGVCLMGAAGLG